MMNIYSLLSILVLPFYIFLGWYVYKLNPDSRINKIFIALAFCFSFWALTFAFFYSATDSATAWFWYNLSAVGRLFYPAIILNLVLIFTRNRFNVDKWYNSILLYIAPLIFLYAVFTGPFVTQDLVFINGQWYETLITYNIWWYVYTAYYMIYIFISFVLIGWWGLRSTQLRERRQAQVMIISGLVAFSLGILTNTFFQYYNMDTLPSIAQIVGIIFFSGIAYAIGKYRMLKLSSSIAAEKIISKVTDLVILMDSNGDIIKTNPQVENLLGYSESELKGKNWEYLIKDEKDRAEIHDFIKMEYIKDDENSKRLEINLKTNKNRQIPFNAFLTIIKDEYGIIGIILMGQDLRPTRKLLHELREKQHEITEKIKAQKAAKEHEEKIRKSLKEKEVLLKEIHHRVKNNMQIISSLLNLQSGYLDDEVAINALKESQVRIMSMAMIHEKLYQSETLTEINFEDYVDHVIKNLFHTYNINMEKFKVNITAPDIVLNIDTAIPCGLIINELVTNSIKHAFPNRTTGEINVQLEQDQNEYYLKVSDDGVGIPQDLDINNTSTLGFLLINSLVNQLDGNLEVNRDAGTTFHIKFKKLEYKERLKKKY